MSAAECAQFLIQLYSDYNDLAKRYSRNVPSQYAKAVALAVMILGEKRNIDFSKLFEQ